MENKLLSELDEQLKRFDVDSQKLDAVMQLKLWQKKMSAAVEKVYLHRLNQIDTMASEIDEEVKRQETALKATRRNDTHALLKLQHQIDELEPEILVEHHIPENFQQLLERTIRVQDANASVDDEDDDLVIVDIQKPAEQVLVVLPSTATHSETTVSKLLTSEPVQQVIAVGLAKTLAAMGAMAATSTTTIAATAIAKTALLTTACGLGTVAYGMSRLAMGTSRKVWSLVISSD